ncbi:MAG: hypothetical protein HWN81_00505 [Candidatus Lokiarchaeota archaeon]|nr:hypothetical protein [Candidatus Lokiarchaeota archaeon]
MIKDLVFTIVGVAAIVIFIGLKLDIINMVCQRKICTVTVNLSKVNYE